MTTATSLSTQFSEVLVASDFGQEADHALAFAKAIARSGDAELLLVHVAQPSAHISVPEGGWFDDTSQWQREEEETEAAGSALRADGFRAKSLCCFGGVKDEIAREVHENHADLVVTGSHGRQGWARFFLGSRAESLAGGLDVPVLIVGPRCSGPAQPRWLLTNIMCCVERTTEGASIAAYACRLAEQHGANLAVAHTEASNGEWAYPDWLDFKKAIDALLPDGQRSNPNVRSIVFDGLGAETLVDFAIVRDTDLLLLGARHRLISWSLAEEGLPPNTLPRLIAEAPCPIMTLPFER